MSLGIRPFFPGLRLARCPRSRFFSTSSPRLEGDAASQKSRSRLERILRKLPLYSKKNGEALLRAPASHVVSFLILHEITAILPLFGLVAVFRYTDWTPSAISQGELAAKWTTKFGNYFRKKGWLGEEGAGRWKWWGRGESTVKIVADFGTAYAIVKVLLPARIIFCLWANPSFARGVVIPLGRAVKRVFTRAGSKNTTSAAGTGAVGGGAVSKQGSAKTGVDKL